MNSYFRDNIDNMTGYVPGEQPKEKILFKLNTNENPYPPSPEVAKCLKSFDPSALKLYPDPVGNRLRDIIADVNKVKRDNVLIGNGSDDILTIVIRAFVGEGQSLACFEPTYSLYPVLSSIQGADCIKVPLGEQFSFNEDVLALAADARLFILCRPNAPTGNAFPKKKVVEFCRQFSGMVLIDEAYADFAEDNCMDLVKQLDNVIVCRTFSKSYSLAGIRLGYVVGSEENINGLMKVKDSYNVNMLTQAVACAAMKDQQYFKQTVAQVCETRNKTAAALETLGFEVMPSQTNFLFVSPPNGDAESYFAFLRTKGILTRYFPGARTGKYLRISIGTDSEMEQLLKVTESFI